MQASSPPHQARRAAATLSGPDAARRVHRFVGDRDSAWRTGSRRSQALALAVLLIGVTASLVVSWSDDERPVPARE